MSVRFQDSHTVVYQGDAREVLRMLPPESVQCVVTSPPYWGLRDYGLEPLVWGGDMAACPHEWNTERVSAQAGKGGNWQQAENGPGLASGKPQTRFRGDTKDAEKKEMVDVERAFCRLCGAWRGTLGLEPTPELYVAHIVEVFREVRRVLRKDGTVWLNMGDCYQGGNRGEFGRTRGTESPMQQSNLGSDTLGAPNRFPIPGLKPKDLCGIPWRVAFALQADGWWLRSDIVWSKPNPMPESVTDRPTRSHEYVFLLSKNARYYYDADAIREPSDPLQEAHNQRYARVYDGPSTRPENGQPGNVNNQGIHSRPGSGGRNKRTVWQIATQAYKNVHFATFPAALVQPCILAGTSERGGCAECGAPWVRVTKRERIRDHVTTAPSKKGSPYFSQETTSDMDIRHGLSVAVSTTGWRASCEHEGEPVPCVVLDPFGGSGTVAVVARRAGRKAILIDMSGEYCELAIERIRQGVLV